VWGSRTYPAISPKQRPDRTIIPRNLLTNAEVTKFRLNGGNILLCASFPPPCDFFPYVDCDRIIHDPGFGHASIPACQTSAGSREKLHIRSRCFHSLKKKSESSLTLIYYFTIYSELSSLEVIAFCFLTSSHPPPPPLILHHGYLN
jgi:hypothetical protein